MIKAILAVTGAMVLVVAVPFAGILVGIVLAVLVLNDLRKEGEEKNQDKEE